MDEVKLEAKRRKIHLLICPTAEAVEMLKQRPGGHERDPACHLLSKHLAKLHEREPRPTGIVLAGPSCSGKRRSRKR